jgi:hypothetical protein
MNRERLTTQDFDPELWAVFDDYVHGFIDRRGFLDRAAKFAVGGVTAAMLLDMMNPQFAAAQQVPKDDKRLKTEWVEIASPNGNGKIKAYLCRPANATGRLPGIVVVHENRGLNPHIEDIARRLALDNFMALAPDALTPLGGYPATKTRRAPNSRNSISRRRARTSSPPRITCGRARIAPGGSGRSASVTAARWSDSWPRVCRSSRRRCRSTVDSRRRKTRRTSRPRC